MGLCFHCPESSNRDFGQWMDIIKKVKKKSVNQNRKTDKRIYFKLKPSQVQKEKKKEESQECIESFNEVTGLY